MLGVEDVVDRGQADVLVAAAVAGDEVRVEQLVVVGRRLRPSRTGLPAGVASVGCRRSVPSRRTVRSNDRHGVVRDVVEEGWPVRSALAGTERARAAVVRRVRLDETGRGDELGEAVRAGDELAVGVGGQQRHVEDVGVGQLDAEHDPRPAP